jgi:carotenoid cleavage dioxygenase-like enzyme
MKVEFPSRQPSKVRMIIEDELDQVETFHSISNKVIANVTSSFNMKNALLTQGSHDWYKHVGNVMNLLMKNHDISESEITEYLVYHSLDTMQLKDKLVLVQSLYGNKPEYEEDSNEIMNYIEQYFEERIITSDSDDTGILLFRTFGDSSTYIV